VCACLVRPVVWTKPVWQIHVPLLEFPVHFVAGSLRVECCLSSRHYCVGTEITSTGAGIQPFHAPSSQPIVDSCRNYR
jgi:hypothetical protein